MAERRPKSGNFYQPDIERMIRAARKMKMRVEAVGITPDGTIITLPEAPAVETKRSNDGPRLVKEEEIDL